MINVMIQVMEGRLKPVEMEGGKALIGDVRSICKHLNCQVYFIIILSDTISIISSIIN